MDSKNTNSMSSLLGQIQSNLQCAICFELLTNPVATNCDHYFCSFCIGKFLDTKRAVQCPLCKKSVTKRSLHPRSELTAIIQGVKKLIAAFEDDTGEPCTPSQRVVNADHSGSGSRKKKNVSGASNSKRSREKSCNETGNADGSHKTCSSDISTTSRGGASRYSSSTKSVASEISFEEVVDGCNKKIPLSMSADKNDGTNGDSGSQTKTKSRKALLQYLEEGTISHPDVPRQSRSADSNRKRKADGSNCCRKELRSNVSSDIKIVQDIDKEQRTQSNDCKGLTFDNEKRSRTGRCREKTLEKQVDSFQVSAKSNADINDNIVHKDESRTTPNKRVCDDDNVATLKGKNLSKRRRRSTLTKMNSSLEYTIVIDDDGEGGEEEEMEKLNKKKDHHSKTESAPGSSKKLTRRNSDLISSNNTDHDLDEMNEKRDTDKMIKRGGKAGKHVKKKFVSNIVNARADCPDNDEVSSPHSACSVSSTQQLQNPIQPVSRTYTKKMKAAFIDNTEDNAKWTMTKTPTSTKPGSESLTNPDGDDQDQGVRLSPPVPQLSPPWLQGKKTNHGLLGKTADRMEVEKEIEKFAEKEADNKSGASSLIKPVLDTSPTATNSECERYPSREENKGANRNLIDGSAYRRKTIFKSRNLSPTQPPKQNLNSSSSVSADLYDFPAGGTPVRTKIPCNRREMGRRRGNAGKKLGKAPIAAIGMEDLKPAASCLKKEMVRVRECPNVTDAHVTRNLASAASSTKRVHFCAGGDEEAMEHPDDKPCDRTLRSDCIDKQEEVSGEHDPRENEGSDNKLDTIQPVCIDETHTSKTNAEIQNRKRKDDKSPVDRSLCKSAVISRGRTRQRVTRKGVSLLEVQEKERETALKQMRSKIEEAEDFEFMFSTQEAQQHIANVNEHDKLDQRSRHIETAFGFESTEESDGVKENESGDGGKKRKFCQTEDAIAVDGGDRRLTGKDEVEYVGENQGNNRELSCGKISLKNVNESSDAVSVEPIHHNAQDGNGSVTSMEVLTTKNAIMQDATCVRDDIHELELPAKNTITSCDVNEASVQEANDAASTPKSHVIISASSISTGTQVSPKAFGPENSERYRCVTCFARPDFSLMTRFNPLEIPYESSGVLAANTNPRNKPKEVDSPSMKSIPESQLTNAVNESPKVVFETPLLSSPLSKKRKIMKSVNENVGGDISHSELPFVDEHRPVQGDGRGNVQTLRNGRKYLLNTHFKAGGKDTEKGTSSDLILETGNHGLQDKESGDLNEWEDDGQNANEKGSVQKMRNGRKYLLDTHFKAVGKDTEKGTSSDLIPVSGNHGLRDKDSGDLNKWDDDDGEEDNENGSVTASTVIAFDTCVDEVDEEKRFVDNGCALVVPDTECPDSGDLTHCNDEDGSEDNQDTLPPSRVTQSSALIDVASPSTSSLKPASQDTLPPSCGTQENQSPALLSASSPETSTLKPASQGTISHISVDNIPETAESTVPPSVDDNGDAVESASDRVSPVPAGVTRKTRRGFARKGNALHQKPLVSLPKNVLSQQEKEAILKEFSSPNRSSKSFLEKDTFNVSSKRDKSRGGGKCLAYDEQQNKMDEQSHEVDANDVLIVTEMNPSGESRIEESEPVDSMMVRDASQSESYNNSAVIEADRLKLNDKPYQLLYDSVEEEEVGHRKNDLSQTYDNDLETSPLPDPSPLHDNLMEMTTAATVHEIEEMETHADATDFIPSQCSSPLEVLSSSGTSDEDKKRLEQELFGQHRDDKENEQESSDNDIDFDMTDSGASSSSQGSSQGNSRPQPEALPSVDPFEDESHPNEDEIENLVDKDHGSDPVMSEESEELIAPKTKKRRVIASDSEDNDDDGDNDAESDRSNESDANSICSSAVSSQSDTLATQDREALEKEVADLKTRIAMYNAALQQGDYSALKRGDSSAVQQSGSSALKRSGSPAVQQSDSSAVQQSGPPAVQQGDSSQRHAKTSSSSSSSNPTVVVENSPLYDDEAEHEQNDVNNSNREEEESDNEDIFILPPSPSPPEKPPSRPPPVASRPAVSTLSGVATKSTNEFLKSFKSPGGSLHKRRPLLDFAKPLGPSNPQTAESTLKDTEKDDDQEVVEVISDSQDYWSENEKSATGETTSRTEDISIIGSGSPVIFSQGKKKGKASSQSLPAGPPVLPLSSKKVFVIVVSGLSGQELQHVHKLISTLPNVRLSPKVSPDVTHVIMKTAPGYEMVCDRTLKYFQGLARRLWIVTPQWVVQSLQAGEVLPEEEFEIQGDTSIGDTTQGPMTARLSKVKLFDNYCFACFGNSPELPRENMEELLSLCGGALVQDFIALPSSSCENKIIISCRGADPTPVEKAMLKGVCDNTGVVSVKRDWVLDSVSSYRVLPLDDYLILAAETYAEIL